MPDTVVLITGTSTGIGFETAVAVAQAGYITIATMRDLGKAQPLRDTGNDIDIRALDVTDPHSVEECLRDVLADYGRLDAVVNNAGAAVVGTAETLTMADIRKAMEVNYFGVVEVTKQALPHLRASGGRVVTVTSVGGAVGQPFNDAYCAAKFAVEGFMQSLAPVAATVGVGVSIVEPGAVATAFVANAEIDPARAIADAGPYAPAMSRYFERILSSYTGAQTGAEVATVIVQALTAEPPVFRLQTSDWSRTFVGTSLADLDGSAVLDLTGSWVAEPQA